MFAFARALFFGALGLMLLIPVAAFLAVIGLPIALVLGILALPVLIVLFVVGLPLLIVGGLVVGILGAVFGVVMAFLSLGFVALKLAFFILVPLMILGWIIRRLVGGGQRVHV
jgi:hypothetical protein